MRSTAIRGWNEYIKLTPGSVLPAPLNRSEVGSIFSVILKIDLGIGLGVVWAAKWGLSIEDQGTMEGKGKGNVGGTGKLKIQVWFQLTSALANKPSYSSERHG